MKKFSISVATVLLSGLLFLSPVYAGQQGPTIYGEITDVIAAAGYTYVQIDTGNGKVWAAGPETSLKVGDRTGFSTNMAMPNFHSKSLNRDFPVIYFVNAYLSEDGSTKKFEVKDLSGDSTPAAGAMGNMGSMGGMGNMGGNMPHEPGMAGNMGDSMPHNPGMGGNMGDNMPHNPGAMHSGQSTTEIPKLKDFAKAKGGNTIAEVYDQKKSLAGKTIRVRGQVIKYTANVMGNNWLHIADSSSKEDLTVVTSDQSAMGEVVVIEGKLELDQDFEFGYFYPVIVKDAKVTKD